MLNLRSAILTLPILLSLSLPLPAHADTKVLTAKGTYTMGEGETMTFAEAMALQKAKQTALEQAGTYVESYTKVQNYQLTADEIQTIAGGVLQVEVLEKKRTLVGDGLKFFVKIKATVTTDKIQDLAERIKGKDIVHEYEQLRKDYTRLTGELEALKALIVKTPSGPDREAALEQMRERENTLTHLQKTETALFKRLLVGETLAQAARDERTTVDSLIHTVRTQGHIIEIGKPVSHVVNEAQSKSREAEVLSEKDKAGIEEFRALVSCVQLFLKLVWTDEFQKATLQRKKQLASQRMRRHCPALVKEAYLEGMIEAYARNPAKGLRVLNELVDSAALIDQAELAMDIPFTVSLSESWLINLQSVVHSLGGNLYSVPSQRCEAQPDDRHGTCAGNTPVIRYLVPENMFLTFTFLKADVGHFYIRTPYGDPQAKWERVVEHLKEQEHACKKGKQRKREDCDRWKTEHDRLEKDLDSSGDYYDRPFVATLFNVSPSAGLDSYFFKRMEKLALVIRLPFQDGSERTCKVPFILNRILPVAQFRFFRKPDLTSEWSVFVRSPYNALSQNFTVRGIIMEERPGWDYLQTNFFVAALPNPVRFQVTFKLPEQRVKELKEVKAEFIEVEEHEDLAQDVCSTVVENW